MTRTRMLADRRHVLAGAAARALSASRVKRVGRGDVKPALVA
jgi:hypothetical protein